MAANLRREIIEDELVTDSVWMRQKLASNKGKIKTKMIYRKNQKAQI
jgi:hypothetical protein